MNDPDHPEPTEYEKWHYENSIELDVGDYDIEEYDAPDWITDLDREICSLLNTGLVLTPSIIAKNLDRPRSSVSRRLNTLEAGGIIEKVERGHYHLTEEGWAKMNERIPTKHREDWPEESLPDGVYSIKVPSSTELERINEQ